MFLEGLGRGRQEVEEVQEGRLEREDMQSFAWAAGLEGPVILPDSALHRVAHVAVGQKRLITDSQESARPPSPPPSSVAPADVGRRTPTLTTWSCLLSSQDSCWLPQSE